MGVKLGYIPLITHSQNAIPAWRKTKGDLPRWAPSEKRIPTTSKPLLFYYVTLRRKVGFITTEFYRDNYFCIVTRTLSCVL